jgi:hypothetical protein
MPAGSKTGYVQVESATLVELRKIGELNVVAGIGVEDSRAQVACEGDRIACCAPHGEALNGGILWRHHDREFECIGQITDLVKLDLRRCAEMRRLP